MSDAYIVRRGGGAGLNLKVIGGTTQPTSPAENTVWVNTSTSITSWVFSAEAPASPTEGMVWIKTGGGSKAPMNIDRKNTVMLYPVACKQYVSGAWADKTAKSCLNGAWTEWVEFVVDGSYHGEELTGGWTKYDNGRFEYVDDGIYIAAGNDAITNNSFDLSKYSRLCFDVTLTQNNTNLIVGVACDTSWSASTWIASTTWLGDWSGPVEDTTGDKTLIVNIADVDEGYLKITSSGVVGTIKRIYLIP